MSDDAIHVLHDGFQRTHLSLDAVPKSVLTAIAAEFGGRDDYIISAKTKPTGGLEYIVSTDDGVVKTYDDKGTPFRMEKELTPKKETQEIGVKFDGGKARYDLIPADALHVLAQLYTMGSNKYDDRNWELGLDYSRVFGAMQRHAWAWMRGEQRDPEDGQPHLASVAWCALALLTYELRNMTELDDRPTLLGE